MSVPASEMANSHKLDLIIVGAGFAGLYMLHRARQLGFNARILEAGQGAGGTWYWNRYPGARCDIESMQYSYQFDKALEQEWIWTERYASQPEILTYVEHVIKRFNLSHDIQYNARVASAVFDDQHSRWTVTTTQGESYDAQFCVNSSAPVLPLAQPPPPPPPLASHCAVAMSVAHCSMVAYCALATGSCRPPPWGSAVLGLARMRELAGAARSTRAAT